MSLRKRFSNINFIIDITIDSCVHLFFAEERTAFYLTLWLFKWLTALFFLCVTLTVAIFTPKNKNKIQNFYLQNVKKVLYKLINILKLKTRKQRVWTSKSRLMISRFVWISDACKFNCYSFWRLIVKYMTLYTKYFLLYFSVNSNVFNHVHTG